MGSFPELGQELGSCTQGWGPLGVRVVQRVVGTKVMEVGLGTGLEGRLEGHRALGHTIWPGSHDNFPLPELSCVTVSVTLMSLSWSHSEGHLVTVKRHVLVIQDISREEQGFGRGFSHLLLQTWLGQCVGYSFLQRPVLTLPLLSLFQQGASEA